MKKKNQPQEGKVVFKVEDKIWHDWYDKLTPEDHCQMLSKLGLDKEEIDEFKEDVFHEGQETKPVSAKLKKAKKVSKAKPKKKTKKKKK